MASVKGSTDLIRVFMDNGEMRAVVIDDLCHIDGIEILGLVARRIAGSAAKMYAEANAYGTGAQPEPVTDEDVRAHFDALLDMFVSEVARARIGRSSTA
jgi:hypothetical protein